MNQWKVGDVTITRVVEAEELWDGTLLLPSATADAVKKEPGLFPAFTTEEGQSGSASTPLSSNHGASASSSTPASATTSRARSRNGTTSTGRFLNA